jgi:MYXO-CTERM domain-containing protein
VPAEIPSEPAPTAAAAIVAALAATVVAAIALGRRRRSDPPDESGQAATDREVPVLVPYNYELEESLTG